MTALRKNAGRLASRAFGRLGSAGGHVASARAEVPLEHTGMQVEAPWQDWQDYLIHRVEGHGRLTAPLCEPDAAADAKEE